MVVTVIRSSNGWYKFFFKDKSAYVSVKYIKKNASGSTFNQLSVITTESLNVRQSRSGSSKNLGQLAKGNKVTIIGSKLGWYTIKLKGKMGYIFSKYTKKVSMKPKIQYYVSVTPTEAYVCTDASNIHKSIGTLKKETKVGVYGNSHGFSKILFQKSYRYIKATDLKKIVTSNDSIMKMSNVSGYEFCRMVVML